MQKLRIYGIFAVSFAGRCERHGGFRRHDFNLQ